MHSSSPTRAHTQTQTIYNRVPKWANKFCVIIKARWDNINIKNCIIFSLTKKTSVEIASSTLTEKKSR